jgi:hypothetical protein
MIEEPAKRLDLASFSPIDRRKALRIALFGSLCQTKSSLQKPLIDNMIHVRCNLLVSMAPYLLYWNRS